MMKKSLIIVVCLITAFAVKAQKENQHISGQKRDQSLKLVFAVCPNADILDIESKEDYLEVEYLCNGEYFEMGIRDDKVLYIETNADEKKVPYAKIRKKLEQEYSDWLLDEISEIFTSDTSFYKVEVLKDGLEHNLFFTTDGKWYKSNPLVISDQWTRDDIEKTGIYDNADYTFSRPDKVYELPSILREISGHTLAAANTVLCVQDELGGVFEYDLLTDEIKNIYRFTDVGDFEGITLKGDEVYVLRSDGMIFHFNYKNRKSIQTVMLSINAMNFESLTYDKSSDKFLVVSKDAVINTPESTRIVYGIAENDFHKPKVYREINVPELNHFIKTKIMDGKSDNIEFNPSDIAVHPITKDVYVLSANDRVLAIYNERGLKSVFPLPAEVYYKPEGISFYENGDMLISSEGDKKGIFKGSIMFLKFKHK